MGFDLELKKKPRENIYLTVEITGDIPEKGLNIDLPFGLSPRKLTWFDLLRQLDRASYDKNVDGIIMKIRYSDLSLSKIYELKKAINHLKSKGKETILYFDYASTKDLMLTGVFDKVFCNPSGIISCLGFRLDAIFFKETMDKLGIKWDVIQMKEYKNAMEPFVNDTLTDTSKMVYNSILDIIYERFKDGVIGEKVSDDNLQKALDKGILLPKEARKLGFVDSILYEAELDEMYQDQTLELTAYSSSPRGRTEKSIALLYAMGPISIAIEKRFGEAVSADDMTEILEKLEDDNDVKAVVMRVISPGGSAIASDIIWHNLREFKKPVVVSFGEMAASGGYYIGMAGDKVLTTPYSLTGSIGVIFSKANMEGLYQKLGINRQTITRGKRADMFSEYRSLSRTERELMESRIRAIYQDFVTKAAESRGVSVDSMEQIAKGRLWIGAQAEAIGLVDTTGGLMDAIDMAAKMAGLPSGLEPRVTIYPKKKGISDFINELIGVKSGEYLQIISLLESLNRENILALYPSLLKLN